MHCSIPRSFFPMLPLLPRCRHPLRHGTLGQQHLLGALANKSTTVHPASVSSKAPLPAASCSVASCSVASSSQQQLSHHGAPASNKPHPAEKSTPAWLAIWHIWAGLANSQSSPMLPHCLPCRVSRGASTLPHRLPLRSIPPQRFACGSSHSRGHGRPRSVRKSSRLRWKCLSMDCRCSDIANLSPHLHRLPTPPAYLRRMRLQPGRGRCQMANEVAAPRGMHRGKPHCGNALLGTHCAENIIRRL